MNEALHWTRYVYLGAGTGRFSNPFSKGSTRDNCSAFWASSVASTLRQVRERTVATHVMLEQDEGTQGLNPRMLTRSLLCWNACKMLLSTKKATSHSSVTHEM